MLCSKMGYWVKFGLDVGGRVENSLVGKIY